MKNLARSTKKKNGIRIINKCDYYECREKSSNFFLNLVTSYEVQKEKNILIGNIKVNSQNHIKNELYLHYKSHYWETARLRT